MDHTHGGLGPEMSKETVVTEYVLVRNLKPGDRVQMNYGDREIKTVESTYKETRGLAVYWTDETGTLYKRSDCVDRVV